MLRLLSPSRTIPQHLKHIVARQHGGEPGWQKADIHHAAGCARRRDDPGEGVAANLRPRGLARRGTAAFRITARVASPRPRTFQPLEHPAAEGRGQERLIKQIRRPRGRRIANDTGRDLSGARFALVRQHPESAKPRQHQPRACRQWHRRWRSAPSRHQIPPPTKISTKRRCLPRVVVH